jgi:hypothetical protein
VSTVWVRCDTCGLRLVADPVELAGQVYTGQGRVLYETRRCPHRPERDQRNPCPGRLVEEAEDGW